MERLDRHLLENMIANHGFSWVFEQLTDIYEDTGSVAVPRKSDGFPETVYVREALETLGSHFWEIENGIADRRASNRVF